MKFVLNNLSLSAKNLKYQEEKIKMKKMRFVILYLLIAYLVLTLIPMSFALSIQNEMKMEEALKNAKEPKFVETLSKIDLDYDSENFRLFDEFTNEISVVGQDEFLFCTTMCEMSPDAPVEALKAQLVAANTYYSLLREENAQNEYDIVWNSSMASIYKPKEEIINSWGDKAVEYEEKVNVVIEEVGDKNVIYDSSLACTSYFAVSNGKTEDAKDVWGGEDYPYLVSVASPYDTLSTNYESKVNISKEEIEQIVTTRWPDGRFDFSLDTKDWFTDITYTLGGGVKSIKICGFTITGDEARSAFSLKSTSFEVEANQTGFVFSVKGYGHGVGMSQTGAMYMAFEGADYIEILNWYYPGTTVV